MSFRSRKCFVAFKRLKIGFLETLLDLNGLPNAPIHKPFAGSPAYERGCSSLYDIQTLGPLRGLSLRAVVDSKPSTSQSSLPSIHSAHAPNFSHPLHASALDPNSLPPTSFVTRIGSCSCSKTFTQASSFAEPASLWQLGFRRWASVRSSRNRIGPSGIRVKRKKRVNESRPAPADAPYVPTFQPSDSPLKEVVLPERVTVRELANLLGEKLPTIESILTSVGESIADSDSFLSIDAAELVALELGRVVRKSKSSKKFSKQNSDVDSLGSASKVSPRPPVIVVMGHVDHGKTSLLDSLRSTSVAAREAGGITQHIGAFVVEMASGAKITFLDTPGHAAFTNMRARGAAITDIVVLVVAADDGVMPQTIEAINHARSAGVPMVVALNKCDKPSANSASVRQQLINEGVELEEIGGDVQVVEISATAKIGLDKLEEAILLQAEMMELMGRTEGEGEGVVIEARVDKGQGSLATVIVKAGQIQLGDYVVVGNQWGRIRSMKNDSGRSMVTAGPSIPIEICGLRGLPEAGDELLVVSSEERARRISDARQLVAERLRIQKMNEKAAKRTTEPNTKKSSLPPASSLKDKDPRRDVKTGVMKKRSGEGDEETEEEEEDEEDDEEEDACKPLDVSLVVKGDVKGTVEAVCHALDNLTCSQVNINVVHSGVGSISASDVAIADATDALCLIGFNVKLTGSNVDSLAKKANVKIIQHRVIYRLLEDVGNLIVGVSPGTKEIYVGGQAEVLQIFESKGRGRDKPSTIIAGCKVIDGRVERNAILRVLRSGETVFQGTCMTLRREKLDVDTVGSGTECGITIDGYHDFRVGDVLQCLKETMRPPKLVSSKNGEMSIEV